ncbi:MAG: type IX secretion system membrane protein PorP/SprF [Flavobacteriia bacterium]|nr:type IX secretion system membrane protein PorP/SprF [Flavobacteriia bacterium]
MKNILIVFGIILTCLSYGQQIPQYSQYMRNQYMANPGAAGSYDFMDITLSGRSQWTGFDNAPMTSYLSFTSPVKTNQAKYNPGIRTGSGIVPNPSVGTGKLKHAYGGQFLADQYGAFRKMQFSGTYAIHLPLTDKMNLSFGTKIGLSNNAFIQSRAVVIDPTTDQTYIDYTSNNASRNFVDIGAGLYLYSNKFFFGLAADQLTKKMISFGASSANYDPQIYFNITSGVKLQASQNIKIIPSFIVKYMAPAPISIEGSILVEYKDWLWTGVSYRNTDAIIAMVGLNINRKLKFGYSYDYSISKFNKYSSGGHELVLGIMLGR